jgi:hypothetical protein
LALISKEKPFKNDFTFICFFPGNLNSIKLINPSRIQILIDDLSEITFPILYE